MSMIEFYNLAANQSVPLVKIGVTYPETDVWAEKKVAAFGGELKIIEAGRGEIRIPETRVDVLKTYLKGFEII